MNKVWAVIQFGVTLKILVSLCLIAVCCYGVLNALQIKWTSVPGAHHIYSV